jgi:hypothetical protein
VIREEGESCLAIEFEHDDNARHAVLAFVAREGYAKHVAVTGSVWDIIDDAPFRLEPAPPAAIASELRAALAATDPRTGRPASQGEDFRALIAAARARSAVV